jgi:hypothetical protein
MQDPLVGFTYEDIVGTWRLVAATRRDLKSGAITDTFTGPRTGRFISYREDGRLVAVIVYDYGFDPGHAEPAEVTEHPDSLLKIMDAYSGTYSVSGFSVRHCIDASWNAIWNGRQVTCDIDFQECKLVLTSQPLVDVAGNAIVFTAVWDKVGWARL